MTDDRAEDRADVLADVLRYLLVQDVPLNNATSVVADVDAVLTQAHRRRRAGSAGAGQQSDRWLQFKRLPDHDHERALKPPEFKSRHDGSRRVEDVFPNRRSSSHRTQTPTVSRAVPARGVPARHPHRGPELAPRKRKIDAAGARRRPLPDTHGPALPVRGRGRAARREPRPKPPRLPGCARHLETAIRDWLTEREREGLPAVGPDGAADALTRELVETIRPVVDGLRAANVKQAEADAGATRH